MPRGYGRARPFLGKTTVVTAQAACVDNTKESLRIRQTPCIALNKTNVSPSYCRSERPSHQPEGPGTEAESYLESRSEEDTVEVGKSWEKMPETAILDDDREFQAGKVSKCASQWAKTTSDFRILSDIRGYKLAFSSLPTQDKPMAELPFSKTEKQFISDDISRLLDKGVIVRVTHCQGEFVSNIFLREKQEPGNFRMILNLKHLNKHVEKQHFKMETFMTTLALVTPGWSFLSFDFSDTDYSCSIFQPHRKYLRFRFQGQLYEFTCLPNGLTSAPRFFTKIMKVALTHLRQTYGMTISGYLDDNLLVNYDNFEGALQEGVHAEELFRSLGFTINGAKSVITPTQVIVHLGFIINSLKMEVSMTEAKTEKIIELAQQILDCQHSTIRQIARVKGKISATRPANQWAQLQTMNLEIDKNKALARNKFDYDKEMQLTPLAREDLKWFIRTIRTSSAPVQIPESDYVIYTDASKEGWGCYEPQTGKKGGGRLDESEITLHINCLKLQAILFGLQSLCAQRHGGHIKIMTDNTTALACVNKQGSVKSMICNEITRKVWQFAIDHEVWLSCPGVENVEADEASRVFNDRTEWTLHQELFHSIVKHFGSPSIDIFASRLNYKVARYCAWQPDPGTLVIDCFTMHWGSEELIYAFPPFSLVHKVLQKLIYDKAIGVVVVPLWPTQPWFSLLTKIMCGIPATFEVNANELYLPFSGVATSSPRNQPRRHPLAGQLTMLAALCNGQKIGTGKARPCGDKATQTQLSVLCSMQEGGVRTDCMPPIWQSGKPFVMNGQWTTTHHLSLKR